MNDKKRMLKKGIASLIAVILATGLIPVMPKNMTKVQAADSNNATKTIVGLETSIIADPTAPVYWDDAWAGSYVYFGTYNGNPVKYRVLDSNTTVFGGTTMLLECDSVLWAGSDPSSVLDTDSNVWADSDIRSYLNGTFLTDNFTALEQNAIAESTKSDAHSTDGTGWDYLEYTPLSEDKIFLLDAKEATNTNYGYSNTADCVYTRQKTGCNHTWWLRSRFSNNSHIGGIVFTAGGISSSYIDFAFVGVSPALNVNLSSVLFSTVISGTAGQTGAEYKLTLEDSRKTVQITDNEKVIKSAAGIITVPYTYTDTATTEAEKVNQISVMITDKAYTENDAEILYYGALQGADFVETSSTGTFVLPNGLEQKVMGADYHIYILAEHVNTTNVTDYASAPVELNIYDEVRDFDIEVDVPVANDGLDTLATASSEIETAVTTWMRRERVVTGNEGYNTVYTVYTVNVTLTAKEGYAFADYTDITINGNAVTVLENNDGTITVSYTFPATAMRTITPIATGYEGTYDGNAHSITVDVTDSEDASVTYSIDEGDNKTYRDTSDKLEESPDTGDNSHIYIRTILFATSGIAIVCLSRKRRTIINE